MKTTSHLKRWRSFDGLKLRYGVWTGCTVPHRGRILVLSGRSEFIEKYLETIQELNRRGFTVYMFDWRGQGLSDRLLQDRFKGHVNTYDDYLADLRLFVEEVVKPGTSGLVFLAHSMGGHLALRFLHDRPGIVRKAVLTSPLIQIAVPKWLRRLLKPVAQIASASGFRERYVPGQTRNPGLPAKPFENNRLTRDRGRFQRTQKMLKENPDLALGGVTFGWLDATMHSIDKLSDSGYAEKITTPLRMFAAEEDRVVSVQAQKAFCSRLPQGRLTVIPHARHEILMETDAVRRLFWSDFDRFAAE